MSEPANDHDLQGLWQSQVLDQKAISLGDIRARAKRFEGVVTRRNLREYVGAAIAIAGFAWILWVGPSGVIRTGAVMFILGVIFVVYRIHARGSATSLPADMVLRSAIDFYRSQLEQQRDLLRGVWLWYLLPLIPGMILVQIGRGLEQPELWSRFGGHIAGTIALAAGIHYVNHRAAGRIQERIDRLTQEA